jgi:hypothetical protein
MEQNKLINFHQKRIELLCRVIEGYLALQKLLHLELLNINPDQTEEINKYLDGLQTITRNIVTYGQIFKESENFLDESGAEIDYSWVTYTQDEWRKFEKWNAAFTPTKKTNLVTRFLKSILK